jgi:diguanylate cyclase (GGDEF)-like protein
VVQGLPPGPHRFEVAVATPAEPWSPAVGLDFEVQPFWWQRADVRAAAGILLLLLALAFPLWRVHALRLREKQLGELVRTRTEDLEAANAALARAASIDFLTGLPNRRAFVQALDKAYADNAAIALAILDVDHFKAYNDNLGHLAGDDCLSSFGRLLGECADRAGATAARVGGEEFALLVLDGRSIAEHLLSRIAGELAQRALPHPASSCSSAVSFSAGLALREARDTRPQDLIARADLALYQAKSQGRNRWVLAS